MYTNRIIQDSSLIGTVDVTKGCDNNTLVVINTTKDKSEIDLDLPKKNIFAINAMQIALDEIGKNIVNTVILGAVSKATGLITLDGLKKAVEQKFNAKGPELVKKNINAITKAYNL